MNQMVKGKDKDKNKNNYNSSNCLVFGRWLQTKTVIVQLCKPLFSQWQDPQAKLFPSLPSPSDLTRADLICGGGYLTNSFEMNFPYDRLPLQHTLPYFHNCI